MADSLREDVVNDRPPTALTLDPLVEAFAVRVAELVAQRLSTPQAGSVPPPLLSKGQLAAALGVSVASVNRYLRRGLITPTVRLGADGPMRFELGEVRAALARAKSDDKRPSQVVDAPPKLLTRRTR